MFENVFGFFKSSKDESAPTQQEQTWNATRMTMEQPTNYAPNQQTQQPVCFSIPSPPDSPPPFSRVNGKLTMGIVDFPRADEAARWW